MLTVVLVGLAGTVIMVGALVVVMQAHRSARREWQEVQAKADSAEPAARWRPAQPPAPGSAAAARSAGPTRNARPDDNGRAENNAGPEDDARPEDDGSSRPAPPHHVVRFDVHLLFAEVRDGRLLLDGLADSINGRRPVSGVPCSLVLEPDATSPGASAVGLLAGTGEGHCELEIDLGLGTAAVRLPTERGAVELPVRAASGLPSLF